MIRALLVFILLVSLNGIAPSSASIEPACQEQLQLLENGLEQKEDWARRMVDASSKVPPGLLTGNIYAFGAFDQCIDISVNVNGIKIQGKIFGGGSLFLRPPYTDFLLNKTYDELSTMIQIGARDDKLDIGPVLLWTECLPAICSNFDVFQHISNWKQIFLPIEQYCQTKTTIEYTGGVIAVITVFSLLGLVMVVSTVYDLALFYQKKKCTHEILVAFSIFSNGRKIAAVTKNPKQISCLNGIRVISMAWIILGHRFTTYIGGPVLNTYDTAEWTTQDYSMYIIGSYLAVDTFLFMGGLVVTYAFLNAQARGTKFNVILYYVHRYLRLTPALGAVIAFYVTIFKYTGSGPFWPSTEGLIAPCRQNWWHTLLYVQNYISGGQTCVVQAWYLAIDMQLFVLSPIFLLFLKKHPKIVLAAVSAVCLGTIICTATLSWVYEMNAMGKVGKDTNGNFRKHYIEKTYTRASPWLIGFVVGYFVYKIKSKNTRIRVPKWTIPLFWCCTFALLCTCVFAGNNLLTDEYNKLVHTLYTALLSPAWATAVGCVVLGCVSGYGQPINWLLSISIFEVVAKLTYSMYLIQFMVIYWQAYQIRSSPWFSDFNVLFIFWGDFCYCLGLGALWTLAFESPVVVVEKLLFAPFVKTKKPKSEAGNET